MTAVWPVTLPPAPDTYGFKIIYPQNVIRTRMDYGPIKQRRRVAWSREQMVVAFVVDSTQLATFETFYKTTVQSGVLPFQWTHPMRQVLGEYRIIEVPDIESQEFGLWYRITLVLEHVLDL